MVLTLAGECYEDKEQDKRLVCEVILNRVSAGNFGGDTGYLFFEAGENRENIFRCEY